MKENKQKIFLDGVFIMANKAMLKRLAPGVVKEKGVFETMRVYGGNIFLLTEHLNRLFLGAKALKIKVPFSKKVLSNILKKTLESNYIEDGRIRLSVWKKGAKVHIAVVANVYKPNSPSKKRHGFSAMISSAVHRRMGKVPCIKSLDYSLFLQAFLEAEKKGYDEAILLNKKGQIVEASRSNIFLVKNKTLITPKLTSGCLNGITRQKILKIARNKGIRHRACEISCKDLGKCDEVFLTNSLIEVMPLTSVNGMQINNGKMGPIATLFLKNYKKTQIA